MILPPIHDELEIGLMIAIGIFGHISCSGYRPARTPVMHGVILTTLILPIGRINKSVGSPSLADLTLDTDDDSDNNTLTIDNGDDLSDNLKNDADSILPVLDYESQTGA
jgi:hypothetical protein